MEQKLSRVLDLSPVAEGERFVTVASIYFKTDSADLDEQDVNIIKEACDEIKKIIGWRELSGCIAEVHVRGFADFRGPDHHNFLLGQKRAEAVRAQVRKVVAVKVVAVSLGEDLAVQQRGKQKLAPALIAEDRRVDIVLALRTMAQVSSRAEFRNLREELAQLNTMLRDAKAFDVVNRVGPLALVVPGDNMQKGMKDSVKGLSDFSTRGKSLSESLKEVAVLMVTELPKTFGKILWTYYWATSADFVETSVQLAKKYSGTAPEGAKIDPQQIEQIRTRMKRIKALLDETTKCQITRTQ